MSDYVIVPSDVIDKDSYIQALHEELDEIKKKLAKDREVLDRAEKALIQCENCDNCSTCRIEHAELNIEICKLLGK